jgi:hypothetical protein
LNLEPAAVDAVSFEGRAAEGRRDLARGNAALLTHLWVRPSRRRARSPWKARSSNRGVNCTDPVHHAPQNRGRLRRTPDACRRGHTACFQSQRARPRRASTHGSGTGTRYPALLTVPWALAWAVARLHALEGGSRRPKSRRLPKCRRWRHVSAPWVGTSAALADAMSDRPVWRADCSSPPASTSSTAQRRPRDCFWRMRP